MSQGGYSACTGSAQGSSDANGVCVLLRVQVQLEKLPEGVPEQVTVACNSRPAVFLVRSQRVRYAGTEMTPSRYEYLAGRGDAKKWKTSIITGSQVRAHSLVMTSHWGGAYASDRGP